MYQSVDCKKNAIFIMVVLKLNNSKDVQADDLRIWRNKEYEQTISM